MRIRQGKLLRELYKSKEVKVALDERAKVKLIENFKIHERDTGSPEVQIALLTERIK
ncbi:MAG: hypothetical protein E3J78_04215, partial [Candidatus Cloacimonadota bacterium]